MANLDLQALEEIIEARKSLHGGGKGAPIKLSDGTREGLALNKACVVLLSASLQAYIEDSFLDCSIKAFGKEFSEAELKRYRSTWNRWGNPNQSNIINLFRRLGIDDVLVELSWQKQESKTFSKKLNTINQIRNCIAHGDEIRVDQETYNLRMATITGWKNNVTVFGTKFSDHALGLIK